MLRLSLTVLAAALTACTSTYKQEVVTAPAQKLVKGDPILIALPKDGAYHQKQYPASGRQTASAVQSAFARYSDRVVISAACANVQCLADEAGQQYKVLVVPEILHWEDRNTEWSGIPDKVEIKLLVVDAASKRTLASTVVSGESKVMSWGGDHPQDLLPEPIKQYVSSLY